MFRRLARLPVRAVRRALRTLQGLVGDPPGDEPLPVRTSPTGPVHKPEAASVPTTPPWVAPTPPPAPAAPPAPKPPTAPPLEVHSEPTPNPNAVKFNLSIVLVERGSRSFDAATADPPPWASAVLAIPGVRSVFAARDFVTVTKAADVDWSSLLEPVEDALRRSARAA